MVFIRSKQRKANKTTHQIILWYAVGLWLLACEELLWGRLDGNLYSYFLVGIVRFAFSTRALPLFGGPPHNNIHHSTLSSHMIGRALAFQVTQYRHDEEMQQLMLFLLLLSSYSVD